MVTTHKLLYHFFTFFFLLSGCSEAEAKNNNSTVLFVYGSSYADTGNQALAACWKKPYGITFPGKPAGRHSDGRVFTDYVAKFMGVKSPIPYRLRKYAWKEHWKNGMNFAYGGSGMFDTLYSIPNMTTQIDFLQHAIKDSVYTRADLNSSVALVVPAGNDYSAFLARNGTLEGIIPFITQVVKQLSSDLKRIRSLGVKKVAVTALAPLGCLPERALNITNKLECNEQENQLADLHNLQLQQAVAELNNGTKNDPFVILDFYQAFTTVIKNKGDQTGSLKFANPLKPCCVGVSSEYGCGSVDENGAKKYSVCDNPQSSLFWDTVHPTQAGWHAIYLNLQSSLQQLVEKKTN